MREIKFRAFDALNLAMVYNVNINDGKPVMPGYQWFSPQNTVHDAVPMQYTGLKDKNGVEIYEGDIVTDGTWASDNEFYKGVVIFLNGCFVTTCNNDCMSGNHVFGWHHLIDDLGLNVIEVIGNIYEHPNLLKDGETA